MTHPQAVTPELLAVTAEDRALFGFLLGWDVTDDETQISAGRFDNHRKMQAIARHRLASASAPVGWRMVPVEPTRSMQEAGTGENAAIVANYDADGWRDVTRAIWSAMLTAAPQPPVPQTGANAALGRFGHHPNPAIDFELEVTEIESITESKRIGLTGPKHATDQAGLERRIELAMLFQVGGDPSCCAAKARLRALATKPVSLSTHLQTLRLDLNDTARSQNYIDGAQDMLDKVAGVVGRPVEVEAMREALEAVRVLICEATEPRSRDPLLQQAVTLIDAALKEPRDDR